MRQYAVLAVLAGCATGPTKPVEEVKYCATIPTNTKPVQACGFPLGIVCFTYEGSISCVRPIITSKT